jgi:DNA-binding MarR family transcriptional regulator
MTDRDANPGSISTKACHAAARLGRVVDKAVDGSELTPAGYRLLSQLATGGQTAATVLADKLSVSRPTVTATIDWLEKREMVVRYPDFDDRRRVRISETGKGAMARQQCDELISTRLREVLASLDPDAADLIAKALDLLHDALIADTFKRHAIEARAAS